MFSNPNEIRNEVKKSEPDQIARPAENQPDISKVNPPTKEFQPSSEVSPLFNRDNSIQHSFTPMSQYYHPANPQEARYPTESTFSSNPVTDTRWLGGDRSPNELMSQPIDHRQPPPRNHQFLQGRNTNIETLIQQMHRNIQRHFYPHSQPSYPSHPSYSDEKISFPSDDFSKHDESWPPQNQNVPALNFKQPKGIWKWIPEEETPSSNFSESSFESEPKLLHQGPHTFHEQPRQQISHDRPYSFDSPTQNPYSHLYINHQQTSPTTDTQTQRYPTGPAIWPSSGASDTLLSTEEYTTSNFKKEQDESGKISDIKILR